MDKILSPVEKARIRDRTTELHKIHKLRPWTEAEKQEWVDLNEQWFESAATVIRAEAAKKRAAAEGKKKESGQSGYRASTEGTGALITGGIN